MQWDESTNGGWSQAEAGWIDVNPNHKTINVANALKDENSILGFYKKMIKLRKETLTLVYGQYQELSIGHEELYIYKRWDEANEYIIFLNLSDQSNDVSKYYSDNLEMVIGNYKDNHPTQMHAWEARIMKTTEPT